MTTDLSQHYPEKYDSIHCHVLQYIYYNKKCSFERTNVDIWLQLLTVYRYITMIRQMLFIQLAFVLNYVRSMELILTYKYLDSK